MVNGARLASLLNVLFLVGHMFGHLQFAVPRRGPEEARLFEALQSFQFEVLGSMRSHWDFYRGSSLLLSVNIALLAALLWLLGSPAASRSSPDLVRNCLLAIGLGYLGIAAASWWYFFPAPGIVTTAATAAALYAWSKQSGSRRPRKMTT